MPRRTARTAEVITNRPQATAMITSASVPKCVASTVIWAPGPGSGVPFGASRLSLSVVEPATDERTFTATVFCWNLPMVMGADLYRMVSRLDGAWTSSRTVTGWAILFTMDTGTGPDLPVSVTWPPPWMMCTRRDRAATKPDTEASRCLAWAGWPRQADDSIAATAPDRYFAGGSPSTSACSRIAASRSRTLRSSDLCSSPWPYSCGGGCLRGTWPLVECLASRLLRLAGCSQGALSVSVSSALASPGAGFHCRGGVTTTDRGRPGCSAAIIAVSARKRCSVANAAAAGVVAPADRLAAVGASASTWVSVLSARATCRPAFTPSGVEVIALGVYSTGWAGGIMLLLSTTAPIWLAARLPSTP